MTAALALVISLFVYSALLPVLLLSLYCAYSYLGRKFSTVYVDSKCTLFIIALFTHTAVFGLFVIICSAVSNISLQAVMCLELVTFGLLLAYEALRSADPQQPRRRPVMAVDVVSLGIAAAAFLLLLGIPFLNYPPGEQPSNALILITGNVDYGTHLAVFNDYLGFGSVRPWDSAQLPRSGGESFYPSSWHAANAAMTQFSIPSIHPGKSSAAALGVINVFWLCVLVFLLVRLAFTLYDLMNRNERKSIAVYVVMALLSLASVYFFVVHIQRYGFFNFTPELLAILLLLYTLHQFLSQGIGDRSALGLAALYCSISLAAWVLLLPVAAGAVLLAIAIRISRRRPSLHDIRCELSSNWPLFGIAVFSVVAQVWLVLTVKTAASVGFSQGLLADGAIPVYDQWVYGALFAGLVSAVLIWKGRADDRPYEPVLLVASATLVMTALLFGYQTYWTGVVHYYYLKSLILLPFVLLPLGIAMAGVLVCEVKETASALVVAVLVPVAVVQLIPSDSTMVSFVRGSRVVSPGVNSDIWSEMSASEYDSKKVSIYLVSSNFASDIATLLVQANRPLNDCFTKLRFTVIAAGIDAAVQDLTSSRLPQSCRNYDVVFKVDQDRAKFLTEDRDKKRRRPGLQSVPGYRVEVIRT